MGNLEIAVHLAVAGDVFVGVFCAVLFPRDVLGETWDLIDSVSGGFPTYKHGVIKVVPYAEAVKKYGGASLRHN